MRFTQQLKKGHRRIIQFCLIAASLLALGASNTQCDPETTRPILDSLHAIHDRIDALQDAICDHYALSGDTPPAFCPDDDPCDLPKAVGPCEALIPRWYFDAETDQCERFYWGGCGGNANNFLTRAECEGTCDPCEVDCGPSQVCVREPDCRRESCDYCADTCRGVECEKGESCELVDVVCVTSPCPPVAQCVPDEEPHDACDRVLCRPGTHCELVDVVCVTEPCPPVPMCVQDEDDECDETVCMDDEICIHEAALCADRSCNPFGDAICVPANPCDDYTRCPVDTICVTRPALCRDPGGHCAPNVACLKPLEIELGTEPCSRVICAEGYVCEAKPVQCLVAPCPDPIPACVPE